MRMIPGQVGPGASRAELEIFDLLRALEVPGWTYAFHSLNLPEHERKRVCEIDFLLLGERGLLVLEAKGGRVSRRNGVWHTRDLRGMSHRLKESPLEQASTAMFAGDQALAARRAQLTGRQSLATPPYSLMSASRSQRGVGAGDGPGQRMHECRRSSCQAGPARLILGEQARPSPPPLSRERQALPESATPGFRLVPGLRHLSRTIEAELVALTELQYRALDTYAQNPRMIFEGGAGTGKTMLAAEICRRAAQLASASC